MNLDDEEKKRIIELIQSRLKNIENILNDNNIGKSSKETLITLVDKKIKEEITLSNVDLKYKKKLQDKVNLRISEFQIKLNNNIISNISF